MRFILTLRHLMVLLVLIFGALGYAFVFQTPSALAAINPQINFQGKLTNPDGTNIADGAYSIVFSLYSASSGGSAVWTETQSSVNVASGNFQVALGSVTSLPGSVDFNSGSIYLGIKVGADAEMTPRIQFTAAPYAFNSDLLDGLSSSNFVQLNPGAQQTGAINVSGNIAAGGTYNGNTFTSSNLQFGATSAASIQAASGQNLSVDSGSSGTVAVGATNATAVNLGKAGTVVNAPGGLAINSGATAPTADQVSVDNTGSSGVTTAGVNGLSVKYKGGAAAIEASGMRVDFTPGATSGGTWSGMRIVSDATGAASGVKAYGIKLEGPTAPGAGQENAIQIASGWDIGIDIQSGGLQMAVQEDPAAPAAGNLRFYAKLMAGRVVPKVIGPSGVDTALQSALWMNNTVMWTPSTAAGVWTGTQGGALPGTNAVVLPTTTNFYTAQRRSTWANVITTANQQVGLRSESMFYRGNTAGSGGFFAVVHFGTSTWTAGNRLFVGLTAGTTAVTTVNPSTLLNIAGFGIDSGDTAISFMHNDGTGTAVKDTIAGQPTLAANQGYDAYIFMKPNDNVVYYRLTNANTGANIIESSASTDTPVANTLMNINVSISNGPTNTAAGAATLGVNRIYVETDR